jgi:hypothetical protein
MWKWNEAMGHADGDARDDCASRRDLHGAGTTVRYAPN